MNRDRTFIFQCEADPELYLVWQPGRDKVLTFRADPEQFDQVWQAIRAEDPSAEILAVA